MAAPTVPEVLFDPVETVNVSALVRIIRRNLCWIGLVTLAAVIGAAIALHWIPSRFQAAAVLQVSRQLPPIPHRLADGSGSRRR